MEDWKKELEQIGKREREYKEEQKLVGEADDLAKKLNIEKAKSFLSEQVEPAFNELATELKKNVKKAEWHGGTLERHLEIQLDTGEEAVYTIRARVDKRTVNVQTGFGTKDAYGKQSGEHTSYIPFKSNGIASSTGKNRSEMDISEITKGEIIEDFMEEYKGWKRV